MRRGKLRSFTSGLAAGWLILTVVACIAGSAPSLAIVSQCESVNASPGAFDPGPRPALSELERIERYRLPSVKPVSGETISFWDFVPAEFYIALGRTKEQVESMGLVEWDLAFVNWRSLRRWDDRRFSFGDRGRVYREIDWLFTMAHEARFIADDADVYMDDHVAGEIAIDPDLASYGRMLRRGPSHDTLWLMVASMYARYRLEVPLPFVATPTRILDQHWHDLDAEPAEVRVSQNVTLRRYLCSHPQVLYLTRRIERMQQSEDPAVQRRAAGDLRDLDAYIEDSLDDFGEFFEVITQAGHRDAIRQLLPANEVEAFDQMLGTEGAAKAFLQMRQALLDVVDTAGESGSRRSVWNRLPPHIRYVWPDRCLAQARYPTNTSPIFGTPWIFSSPCDARPMTRQQVLQSAQESN